MEEKKYLDNNGLAHLWLLLKGMFIQKEHKTGSETEYKVLSDNNLTDELVTKINNAGDSSFTGDYEDLTNKPNLTVFAKTEDMNTAINTATTDMATKTYVTEQFANMNKKEIVTSIEEMTDGNTIYLMANSGTGNNSYDEYIVVNGKAEKIGTTEVDLSNYIQKSDLVTITNAEIDQIIGE
ncbi:MAG: hypothetical protein HFJ34_04690 [Clostridia bacterium]|nr:hypothetical protein [Clostridia bacterium]